MEDAPLSLPQLLRTGRGRVAVAAELLALAAMLPLLWVELCTLAAYGLAWLGDAWRLLGLATYALQVGGRAWLAACRQDCTAAGRQRDALPT